MPPPFGVGEGVGVAGAEGAGDGLAGGEAPAGVGLPVPSPAPPPLGVECPPFVLLEPVGAGAEPVVTPEEEGVAASSGVL